MTRESGSEQTQRTVAELLAQYGASGGDAAPRRRRRRAEDVSDTAPQQIIERVLSDSGPIARVTDDPVDEVEPPQAPPPPPVPPSVAASAAARTTYTPPVRPAATGQGAHEAPLGRAVPPVDAAEETALVPPITDDYAPPEPLSRPNIPKPPPGQLPPEQPVRPGAARPPLPVASLPVAPQPIAPPPIAPQLPREPVTEQIPRIADKLPPSRSADATQVTAAVPLLPPAPATMPDPLPGQTAENWFGHDPAFASQEQTQTHPAPYVDDEDGDPLDGRGALDREVAERRPAERRPAGRGSADLDDYADEDYVDDEGPAGLDDVDEVVEDEEQSPAKEWAVMAGQLAVGVVGGAGLWLGFNFLWRTLAPAALVVALAVTVGLVMLVRKIRKADDLQTTVLAVLVGLIVTVSPAAMLLVKS
ncbi:hypothetical protein [Umezawaea beigongshangensis]|uniref:hypothetical protein n=1 Tax=Umezawaea beigongshangensis TaxID=2780383 RepID=UPI0018F2589B|nr:hypothetical protein [Umezawaea beigongshangensis]